MSGMRAMAIIVRVDRLPSLLLSFKSRNPGRLKGGFIIAGNTNSLGAGGFDGYLLAVDSTGELKWERAYGGASDDQCWSAIPTSDGGYALVGETWSSGAGAEDCWLIKTDAAGKEEWSRTYGGNNGDRAFSIEQAPDGGCVFTGHTTERSAGDLDLFIVKVGANGTANE